MARMTKLLEQTKPNVYKLFAQVHVTFDRSNLCKTALVTDSSKRKLSSNQQVGRKSIEPALDTFAEIP